MVRFLNLIAAEPDISKVPVMIDSSKWEILAAYGLLVVGRVPPVAVVAFCGVVGGLSGLAI